MPKDCVDHSLSSAQTAGPLPHPGPANFFYYEILLNVLRLLAYDLVVVKLPIQHIP
jgi:hypothetical protein